MIKLKLSKKYSKSIFYLTISLLFIFFFAFVSKNVFNSFSATYTNITSQVTVGNSAPTITTAPTEETATLTGGTSDSCAGAATSGDTVTFKITGTDPNGATHNYYLIVCSTNSVTPGAAGAAPSCGATKFCGSTATASGSQASCTYNSSGTSAWSTAWYAFVCDNYTGGSLCSASSQGSGNSGSPLFVNHAPAFSVANISAAANPGGTFTWTTTSSDPDAAPMNNIKLLVCKTTGLSAGACDGGAGDTWCSTAGTETSNSTCGYVATGPYADGSYNAYPYIVDECNLASTGTAQGVNKAFTVNNVAPVVSSVTLNGGAEIGLTDGTTKAVPMTASVFDDNGCRNQGNTADEISNVKGYAYRSAITYATCDTAGEANANNCYPEVSCSAGTCTNGVTTYTCSASLQYYADATKDHALGAVLFTADTWKNTLKATDDDASVHSLEVTTGVELAPLVGGDTTPTTLDFGTVNVGSSNDPLDKILTTTPTGNVGIDVLIKANTATMCTNYSTCTGGTPIPITHQRYALTSSTSYASGTALTTSDVEVELNVQKQTSGTVPSKQWWWGIAIPTGTLPGVYNGLNVVTYKFGESANW